MGQSRIMPTRPSKLPRDANQRAKMIVDIVTGNAPPPEPDTRNPAALHALQLLPHPPDAAPVTPAMEAGLSDYVWELDELVAILDA